jgi:hypothetical protein
VSGRVGSLGKALQHQEIGHDACSADPSQNRVAVGAPRLQYRFPLIVHYLVGVGVASGELKEGDVRKNQKPQLAVATARGESITARARRN